MISRLEILGAEISRQEHPVSKNDSEDTGSSRKGQAYEFSKVLASRFRNFPSSNYERLTMLYPDPDV
jgi:hypothetical protein